MELKIVTIDGPSGYEFADPARSDETEFEEKNPCYVVKLDASEFM